MRGEKGAEGLPKIEIPSTKLPQKLICSSICFKCTEKFFSFSFLRSAFFEKNHVLVKITICFHPSPSPSSARNTLTCTQLSPFRVFLEAKSSGTLLPN
jgi:hypothetical protein